MNFNSFVSDLSLFDIGTLDLRTNPFEEGGNDRPRSTDQYMEPNQHEVQDVLKFSTEVHDFHHTGQTDRTVPNASALTVLRLGFSSASRISLPPLPLDFSSEGDSSQNFFFSFLSIFFFIIGDHKGVKEQPGSKK